MKCEGKKKCEEEVPCSSGLVGEFYEWRKLLHKQEGHGVCPAVVEDMMYYRTEFCSIKLNLIVILIRNFLFEQGGEHNSKIEIPSCEMHVMSLFCPCFNTESESVSRSNYH